MNSDNVNGSASIFKSYAVIYVNDFLRGLRKNVHVLNNLFWL